MKENQIQIHYNTYKWEELSETYKNLMNRTIEAQQNAYAPYSNFKVGAAILLEDGTIFTGNNQENSAFPSGLCAERVAIFNAGANFPNQKIKQIAIVAHADFNLNKPVMPCGACRQAMIEYEQRQGEKIEVLLQGNKGNIFVSESVSNLLPYAFECEALKK